MNCSKRLVPSTAAAGSCDAFGSLSSHNSRKVSCVDADIKPAISLGDFKRVTGSKQLSYLKNPPALHTSDADHMGIRGERAVDQEPVREKAVADGSHRPPVRGAERSWGCCLPSPQSTAEHPAPSQPSFLQTSIHSRCCQADKLQPCRIFSPTLNEGFSKKMGFKTHLKSEE